MNEDISALVNAAFACYGVRLRSTRRGSVAEWFKALVLKTG